MSTSQFYREITALPDGGSVAVWLTAIAKANYRVMVQKLDAAGQAVGAEAMISGAVQGAPQTVALADGGFVVGWTSAGPNNTADIYAQRFDAAGLTAGTTFLVNNGEYRDQLLLELAPSANGGFVALFSQPQQDAATSSPGHNPNAPPATFVLTAQAFDMSGAKAGGYVSGGEPVPRIGAADIEALLNSGLLTPPPVYDIAGSGGGGFGSPAADIKSGYDAPEAFIEWGPPLLGSGAQATSGDWAFL